MISAILSLDSCTVDILWFLFRSHNSFTLFVNSLYTNLCSSRNLRLYEGCCMNLRLLYEGVHGCYDKHHWYVPIYLIVFWTPGAVFVYPSNDIYILFMYFMRHIVCEWPLRRRTERTDLHDSFLALSFSCSPWDFRWMIMSLKAHPHPTPAIVAFQISNFLPEKLGVQWY